MISAYPFVIKEFHADNGSEYINYQVADMLNKLLIKLTKSRPRNTNDNALVESKNGSIVRKHMGYLHIPASKAPLINEFYMVHLNPYLNYHRPCAFVTKTTVSKHGKQKKKYGQYITPYEKLKSLQDAEQYLKKGITFEILDKIAYSMSDNEAAKKMQEAKQKLFDGLWK
jgi:transposase InsO family protein